MTIEPIDFFVVAITSLGVTHIRYIHYNLLGHDPSKQLSSIHSCGIFWLLFGTGICVFPFVILPTTQLHEYDNPTWMFHLMAVSGSMFQYQIVCILISNIPGIRNFIMAWFLVFVFASFLTKPCSSGQLLLALIYLGNASAVHFLWWCGLCWRSSHSPICELRKLKWGEQYLKLNKVKWMDIKVTKIGG